MEFFIWVLILAGILKITYSLGEISGIKTVEQSLEAFARKITEVKVDLHNEGNVIYVFETGTGRFIIQGEGWEDTMSALEKAHPGTVFIAHSDKIEELRKITKGE